MTRPPRRIKWVPTIFICARLTFLKRLLRSRITTTGIYSIKCTTSNKRPPSPVLNPLSCHAMLGKECIGTSVGGDRGSETPASRAFYSRFPPPSVGVPASLFYFYCKMLRDIAKFFSFSPGSRHFGNPTSRPFSSRPLFSRAPAPLSPSTQVSANARRLDSFLATAKRGLLPTTAHLS